MVNLEPLQCLEVDDTALKRKDELYSSILLHIHQQQRSAIKDTKFMMSWSDNNEMMSMNFQKMCFWLAVIRACRHYGTTSSTWAEYSDSLHYCSNTVPQLRECFACFLSFLLRAKLRWKRLQVYVANEWHV